MVVNIIKSFARCAVLELSNEGYYNTEEEYTIELNGRFYKNSTKVVESLYDLKPDTEYQLVLKRNGKEEAQTVFQTKKESVTLNVREFGALGDGQHNDTINIQCAINACPENGRILIPKGTYKVTSLFLKSHILIELAKDATVSAIPDRQLYPILPGILEGNDEETEYNFGTWEGNPLDCFAAVITGLSVEDVAITGQGTIDGCASKENWWHDAKIRNIAWRPRLVFLNRCNHVTMQGVTVTNSPSWNIHPYFSNHIKFLDLKIINPKDSPNTDGLDPESCSNVDIIGVYFSVGDDCIAIKSGKIYMGAKYKTPSINLMIRHCMMRDGHGSITIGSEMAGGVRNLTVRECEFIDTDRGLRIKTRRGRGRDAVIDGVLFEQIRMDQVLTPIVINSFYFCDPDGHSAYVQSQEALKVDERTPILGEFTFRNLVCSNCHAAAAFIIGLPEEKIKRVAFENVSFTYAIIPSPSLPAMMDGLEKKVKLGVYAKNVQCLELKDVNIKGANGDAVITENVNQVIME